MALKSGEKPEDRKLVDIGIKNGVFEVIDRHLEGNAASEIDAGGRLVSPPFVDPHLHLDAALTAGKAGFNNSGTLLEGIKIWGEYKKTLTHEEVKERAYRAVTWLVSQGTTFIRSHVDVSEPSFTAVKALIELRDELKGKVDIQLVAFPQDGIFTHEKGEELLARSMEMGLDVVGGIPHNEFTREEGIRDVEYVFSLAEKYGALIDIHCDETDDEHSRFLETVASLTIKNGLQGRITASHTTAMHSYNNAYASKLIRLLARGDLNIIVNPFDNSILQARGDSYPKRRGITRVDELLAAGVNVSVGHDSIMDPWYPLGKGSMLQAANLLIHLAQLAGHKEIYDTFLLITERSAATLNIQEHYGIKEGHPADLIIINALDEHEALRVIPEILYVIRNGEIVAQTSKTLPEVILLRGKERVDYRLK